MGTDCFTREAFDAGTQCQVVALNALGEYFARQMLIFAHFSGITPPVITGYHANTEWGQQRQQFPTGFVSTGTESLGHHAARFRIAGIPKPVLPGLATHEAPLFIQFTDERDISATSAWVTGEDVIRFGVSFLKCG